MNNKFQDGEKVLVKDRGVIETVDKWSYVPSMRRFTYTTIENPATFYFESELELPQAIEPNEQPSEAVAEDKVYGNDCRTGQC